MLPDRVLAQWLKRSEVLNFFSVIKQVNFSESVANVLKLATDDKGGSGSKKIT